MFRACKTGVIALAVVLAAARCPADPPPRVPPRAETFKLLEAADFASLEKITNGLRGARLGFYNGWPPIHVFYSHLAFATPDDQVWQKYIGLLTRWQAAYPDSPTPRIALANLYRDYAWQARGSGYSDTVTTDGWRLFDERLKKARSLLEEAKELKTQDAEAYLSLIVVAKGLGLPRGQMEEAFNRGLQVDPDFTPIYSAKAEYLLPRWRGATGDWEAFATEAADRRKGDDGDILYMFIVRAEAYTGGDDLFTDTALSYPRMKRGFLASRSRYPENRFELNSFCYFASIAGDKEMAAKLFTQIGEGYEREAWGNLDEFTRRRDWAREGDLGAMLDLNRAGIMGLKIAVVVLLLLLVGLVIYFVKPRSLPPPTASLQ
jgi:hypothetical protein